VTSMSGLVAGLPDQLRWAASLHPPRPAPAEEALVLGMGGSGMAGSIAAVVAESCGRRVAVHRSFGLPSWAAAVRPLVIAVSHSGDTEETLSGVEEARRAGLSVAAVTTGGRLASRAVEEGLPLVTTPPLAQPRAAVGYLAGGALRLLEAAGVVPSQVEGLGEAAEVVARLVDEGRGPAVALAADLAEALEHRVAVVYGAEGPAAVAAYRWKTQINENAKAAAYCSVLPELDHNEIEAWGADPRLAQDRIGLVWLHDPGGDERLSLRTQVSQSLLEGRVGLAGEVHAQGKGVLARLFSLIVVGDLVAVALAERAGVDPMAVPVITALKGRLSGEGS
jgi:glucose/mannose-6-phosphate isomerase